MKPEELRIGNYIEYMGKVVRVNSNIIREVELNNATALPIEITSEILNDLGFKKERVGHNTIYSFNNIKFEEEIFNYKIILWFNFDNDYTEIRYVHQLQNLIYILTEKELTLKNI